MGQPSSAKIPTEQPLFSNSFKKYCKPKKPSLDHISLALESKNLRESSMIAPDKVVCLEPLNGTIIKFLFQLSHCMLQSASPQRQIV
jgi:hypothetical protein